MKSEKIIRGLLNSYITMLEAKEKEYSKLDQISGSDVYEKDLYTEIEQLKGKIAVLKFVLL
jgi:hypothetical protein